MNKRFKRIPMLLTGAAMLLCLLAGCAGNGNKPNPTPSTGASSTVSETDPYQADQLPDGLDFEGETVHVLTWQETRDDDWFPSASGDIIPHAVYTSREFVAERLDVTFDVVAQNGSWDFRNQFISNLRAYLMNGLTVDLIGQYTPAAALGAMTGLYADLNQLNYVNFDNPWWPGNIQQSCSIGDHVYFCSGDITQTCISAIGAMFVNLDLWTSYTIEGDIYEIIANREWTMERMQELVLGVVGESGSYAVAMPGRGVYDNLFYSGGLSFVEHDEENQLRLSGDISGSKMDDWYEICRKFLHDNSDVVSGAIETGITITDTFMTQRSIIWMSQTLSDARDYLKDATFNFAVVPYPMYDANQADYRSITGYWVTMFSVPANARNPELSGAVLEALASSGYRYLTPKVYETSFQHRFLQTPENAEMLNLIHDSIVYDTGRIFADDIAMFNLFRRSHENVAWMTYYQENWEIWEANIEKVTVELG